MGIAYTSYCKICGVQAPEVGDAGHIGLPSSDPARRRGPSQSFGFVYIGLAALGFRTYEVEALKAFLVEHSGHPMCQQADDQVVFDQKDDTEDKIPVRPKSRRLKIDERAFVDAFYELRCERCADQYRSAFSERLLPFESRILTKDAISAFRTHVAALDSSNFYRASPLPFDDIEIIERFLKKHAGHGVVASLDLGEKSTPLSLITRPWTPPEWDPMAHERALGVPSTETAMDALFDLRHHDPAIRRAALIALAQCGESSLLGYMVSMLDDPETSVRVEAIRTLAALADDRRVRPIGQALCDEAEDVRSAAQAAAARIGVPEDAALAEARSLRGPYASSSVLATRESLDAAIRHPNPWTRHSAVEHLAKPGIAKEHWAQELLLLAVADPSHYVRQEALRTLERRKIPWGGVHLQKTLSFYSVYEASMAVEALDSAQLAAAFEPLMELLARCDIYMSAYTILRALEKLADPREAERLSAVFRRHPSAEVRKLIAERLGSLRAPCADEALAEAIEDSDGEIRKAALAALGENAGESTAARLRRRFGVADEDERSQILEALIRIQGPEARRVLTASLRDRSRKIRYRAAVELSQLPRQDGDRALIAAARRGDAIVALGAWRRLVVLGAPETIDALKSGFESYWSDIYEDARAMAGSFLQCGHPGLATAARQWLKRWKASAPRRFPKLRWGKDEG